MNSKTQPHFGTDLVLGLAAGVLASSVLYAPALRRKVGVVGGTDNIYHFIPNLMSWARHHFRGESLDWNPYIGLGIPFAGSAHNPAWSPVNHLMVAAVRGNESRDWPQPSDADAIAVALSARMAAETALAGVLIYFSRRETLHDPRWAFFSALLSASGSPMALGPSFYPAPTTIALSAALELSSVLAPRIGVSLASVGAGASCGALALSSHPLYFIYSTIGTWLASALAPLDERKDWQARIVALGIGTAAGTLLAAPRIYTFARELVASKRFSDFNRVPGNYNDAFRHWSSIVPEMFGTNMTTSIPITNAGEFGIHAHGYPAMYYGVAPAVVTIASLFSSGKNARVYRSLALLLLWRMKTPVLGPALSRIVNLYMHPSSFMMLNSLITLAAGAAGQEREEIVPPRVGFFAGMASLAGAAIGAFSLWSRIPVSRDEEGVADAFKRDVNELDTRRRIEARLAVRRIAVSIVAGLAQLPLFSRVRGLRTSVTVLAAASCFDAEICERSKPPTLRQARVIAGLGVVRSVVIGVATLIAMKKKGGGSFWFQIICLAVIDVLPAARTLTRMGREPFVRDRLYPDPKTRYEFDGDHLTAREAAGALELDIWRVNHPHRVLGIGKYVLADNIASIHGVRTYGGLNSLFPERTLRFLAAFDDEHNAYIATRLGLIINDKSNERMLDIAGVRYDDAGEGKVGIRDGAVARFTWFDNWQVVPEESDQIERLKDPTFDPASVLLIESDPPFSTNGTRRPLLDRVIRPVRTRPTRHEISLSEHGDGLLFFGESFDNGWSAFVDGVRTPILRAHHAFMAVPIRANSRTITLEYADPHRPASLMLSFLGLAMMAAASIFAVIRSKNRLRA